MPIPGRPIADVPPAYGWLPYCGIALEATLRYVLSMQKQSFMTHAARAGVRSFTDAPVQEKLAHVVDWLRDHKAVNVVSIDLTEQGGFAEAMVIAGASSVRHAQSLADGVGMLCHERHYEYLHTEGYAAGQWILVDMNDIIVNIFSGNGARPVRS